MAGEMRDGAGMVAGGTAVAVMDRGQREEGDLLGGFLRGVDHLQGVGVERQMRAVFLGANPGAGRRRGCA